MSSELTCFVAALSVLGLSGTVVLGQTRSEPPSSLDQVMEQIAAVRRFTEVAIAPDGKQVAWVDRRLETTHPRQLKLPSELG